VQHGLCLKLPIYLDFCMGYNDWFYIIKVPSGSNNLSCQNILKDRSKNTDPDYLRNWKSYIILIFIGVLFFSASAGALAEEVNLESALELFYKNNYDIIINRYEIDKARGDYVAARIVPNPNFSVNYTGLRPGVHRADFTQLIYRLDQLIELGGKRSLRIQTANEMLEATRLAHKDTVRTLLIGFYANYYELLLYVLSFDLAREQLERFDKILAVAEKRHSAGFLSLIDYTKLKIARIDLENSLTTIDTQYKNDLAVFNLLLGGEGSYKPSKEQMGEGFPVFVENDLVDTAYDHRFDLLSLQKQFKSAEYAVKLAKAQRIPDITVGGEYGGYGRDLASGYGAGVGINIPIFYQNQGEILKRTAEYDQVKIQIERIKKQILVDIKQALNNYQSGTKIFDSYKTRKDEMEGLLNGSEKAFSLGGITVLELLDTHKTYREFITKYHQALIQATLNKDLIKVYTGEIK
jgi:outer membrane protein, heavy metal efflux system